MVGSSRGGWRVRLVLVALGVACLLGVSIPIALGGDSTPTWQLKSYYSRGFDRSFKADLYQEMPSVPRVLVFGGSRSLRMDPATIKRETGLTAFNFGFHNGRPEDAWAVTDWVLDTHPDKPPAVIWCLQATTLADVPMNPGLIVDERLSQAFPKSLIDAKMAWAMKQRKHNVLAGRRFGYDGMLWWNRYDTRRKAGLTLQRCAQRLSRRRHAGQGRQPQDAAQHARHGLLRADHPPAEREPHQAAHRDHAVPASGAERVPLRGLGRQAAVAAQLPLQAVGAPGLQGARLPAHQHLRRNARTGSTTARTSTPRTRAGSSATASRTRRLLQAAQAPPRHRRRHRRRRRRRARAPYPARRWCRPRPTRRCPRTRARPADFLE